MKKLVVVFIITNYNILASETSNFISYKMENPFLKQGEGLSDLLSNGANLISNLTKSVNDNKEIIKAGIEAGVKVKKIVDDVKEISKKKEIKTDQTNFFKPILQPQKKKNNNNS